MKQKIIIITGATAVGKTKLSIDLAKQFNGEIISADSMQIYKGANIGSAKITQEEMQGITHHLIDICEPYETFNAGEFAELAKKAIGTILAKHKVPIVVGGTGLYISTLLFPLSTPAKHDDNLRAELIEFKNQYGGLALYEKLKEIDSQTANELHPNQTDRIIRAIEIFKQTGTKKSELIKNTESEFDYLLIVVNCEREKLYSNINLRVDKMVQEGLFEEVKNLIEKYNITEKNQIMQGIGYKEVLACIKGEISKKDCIELIKQRTRNYAKRQITWFKKMPNAQFVDKDELDTVPEMVKKFLGRDYNE